jgi:hypothetical protein
VVRHDFTLTTDGSGNATVFSSQQAVGEVRNVRYVPDGSIPLTNTANVTVTLEGSGLPIIAITGIGSVAATWAPLQATHTTAAAAALYAAGGTAVTDRIGVCNERIKVTVSGGGASKTGVLYVWVG